MTAVISDQTIQLTLYWMLR